MSNRTRIHSEYEMYHLECPQQSLELVGMLVVAGRDILSVSLPLEVGNSVGGCSDF